MNLRTFMKQNEGNFKLRLTLIDSIIVDLRPGSDEVLRVSRIEFNEFSSCELQRLNLFSGTADVIR